mmetsp:Transcript_12263/g.29127  ORF Transcript_12263/g.29127 Transcript_12263/m.29127 type:complete len:107 (-) Transcript_12263:163-483(-)
MPSASLPALPGPNQKPHPETTRRRLTLPTSRKRRAFCPPPPIPGSEGGRAGFSSAGPGGSRCYAGQRKAESGGHNRCCSSHRRGLRISRRRQWALRRRAPASEGGL